MDFDALDFTFLDGEDAVLSTEGTAAEAAKPKTPDSDLGAGDDFDLAAWDSAEPQTDDAPLPKAAAPDAALAALDAPMDFGGDDESLTDALPSFDADLSGTDAEADLPMKAAPSDPFADLRSPDPELEPLAHQSATDEGLSISFGDEAFESGETEDAAEFKADAPISDAFFDGSDEDTVSFEDDAEAAPEALSEPEPKAPVGPRKYLFDRSFDYVPPPPPPTRTGTRARAGTRDRGGVRAGT
ncbi:hypothetical protein VZ95_13875, partial [Elstera litoralis]